MKLALETEWNRLSQTFINKSIDEWRRLKLLSRTMDDIWNIFSYNLNDLTVCINFQSTLMYT